MKQRQNLKVLHAEQMRNIDRRTVDGGFFTGIRLMENAGRAAAQVILEQFGKRPYHILTGRGNNGGDGFVIAAYLAEKTGCENVILHCLCIPESGDALSAYRNLPPGIVQKNSFRAEDAVPGAVLIDCLLGTGFRPPLREPFADWIAEVNHCRPHHRIVSIDIPSGLDADAGTISEKGAVQADLTLTFAALKSGLILKSGAKYSGKIRVLDIGIPAAVMNTEEDALVLTDSSAVRKLLMEKRQDYDTYKQKRGHVLVIGGSADYPSAPFLAAEAALRSGAGLVTAVIPDGAEIFCSVPKALIVRRVPGGGYFRKDAVPAIVNFLEKTDAVVIGPGMSTHPDCAGFFSALLPLIPLSCSVLLDADALNLLAKNRNLFSCLNERTILTPHAGELARLGTYDFGDAVVVKKGLYSTICQRDRCTVNFSGSPALATAGSGDVLSGMIAAFAAQKYDPFSAAGIGVWLHGRTGEICGTGSIADDLPAAVPRILQDLTDESV